MGSVKIKLFGAVLQLVAIFLVSGIVSVFISCDTQSIVEPRFFEDSEIMDVVACEGGPVECDTSVIRATGGALPGAFWTGVCRSANDARKLFFQLDMPASAKGKWLLIGAGGNTVLVLIDQDQVQAGHWHFGWCGRDSDGKEVGAGVYGVTFRMVTGGHVYTQTRWFELE